MVKAVIAVTTVNRADNDGYAAPDEDEDEAEEQEEKTEEKEEEKEEEQVEKTEEEDEEDEDQDKDSDNHGDDDDDDDDDLCSWSVYSHALANTSVRCRAGHYPGSDCVDCHD
eukprot:s1965_g6.t1